MELVGLPPRAASAMSTPASGLPFEHILASDVAFDVGLGRINFELVG